jgi:hypothetical protein
MIHLLVQTRAVGDAPAGVVATGNADTTGSTDHPISRERRTRIDRSLDRR